MLEVEEPERIENAAWSGAVPAIAVVVSTYQRSPFLADLVAALEDQSVGGDSFEVVLVDNGSTDGTWETLGHLVPQAGVAVTALRLPRNVGPAGARNVGAAAVRAPVIAFTDDDCLPTSDWLEHLSSAMDREVDVVQGTTVPRAGDRRTSAWDRTVTIREGTGLFETCNIAYRRRVFEEHGGFDASSVVVGHRAARPFGEDAELGWRVERAGGRVRFAPEAVVHHRWLPASYRDWLAERRQLANFAALARRIPGFRRRLFLRYFLSPTSAAFDLAVLSALVGVTTRTPWSMIGAVPWVLRRWPDAAGRSGRHPVVRLGQLAVGDAIGLRSLVEGSLHHRAVVL